MGCYWPQIQAAKAIDLKMHGTVHYNGGVASILCPYPNATQTNQGFLFLQEFFVDSFIGIVIWACLDPANPFVSASGGPFCDWIGVCSPGLGVRGQHHLHQSRA
jgi:hypothetical protein